MTSSRLKSSSMEGWSSAMLWAPRFFKMAPASSSSVLALMPVEKARISSTLGRVLERAALAWASSICWPTWVTFSSYKSSRPVMAHSCSIIKA